MARIVVQGYINATGVTLPLGGYEHELTESDGLTGFIVYPANEAARAEVYENLSAVVEAHGGRIGWHMCSHGDPEPSPCVPVDIMAR